MADEKTRLDEKEARDFFSELYYGEHHLPNKLKPYGPGWSIQHFADLSTFDHDFMTRLVFLAHDLAYRASIMQSGPGTVKILLWKRQREGRMYERHPTIEQALKEWRARHNTEASGA